jgi:molybdopterin/thiamine biosynthesis adenylyltransferase
MGHTEEDSAKRVVIVGAGALGSHVALLLRNAAALTVVDFDRVSSANLQSQFHARSAVSKNKAVALQGLMQLVYSVKVEALPVRLVPQNLACLPVDTALVIDACDNAAGRHAAQLGANLRLSPCLHGGLAAAGAYGMVRWDEEFLIEDPPVGAATCEDGEHVPFIVEVASRMAMAAQRYLQTGEKRGYAVSPDGVMRV